MVYAAVLAGGSGLRMGGDLPKQFLSVGDRPIIIRSIDAFYESGLTDEIYVAVSADYIDYMKKLAEEYCPDVKIKLVAGGSNRNQTLYRVLKDIESAGMNDDDIILTHDAVRPFIDSRIIRDNIDAVKKYGACDTVISAVDTMIQSIDGEFIGTIPVRSELFHGQTPQSFNACQLLELYEQMTEQEFEIYTDACSIYVKENKKVKLVQGDRNNIKLTYPEDMEKAEIIVKNREKK